MDNRAIGVFDSGLGGLTVVGELIKRLENEHIVYFGDTGRVPYGTKSRSAICRYAEQDEAFLMSKNVKMIIVACGTVSSVAYDVTKKLPVPSLGVVAPASRAAVKATKNRKIGVIGTEATIKSGAFRREILSIDGNIEIYDAACSVFVPIVEAGWIKDDDEITIKTAERYLTPLKNSGIDTLILGCTHFPIISGVIKKVMGESVTLISSGAAAADEAAGLLKKNGMLRGEGPGKSEFFVSDNPESFSKIAGIFLGKSDVAADITRINIEEY